MVAVETLGVEDMDTAKTAMYFDVVDEKGRPLDNRVGVCFEQFSSWLCTRGLLYLRYQGKTQEHRVQSQQQQPAAKSLPPSTKRVRCFFASLARLGATRAPAGDLRPRNLQGFLEG